MNTDIRETFEALDTKLEGLRNYLETTKYKRLTNKAVKLSRELSELKIEYADVIFK